MDKAAAIAQLRGRRVIYAASFMRAFGASMASVLVGLYLSALGRGTLEVGMVITASMAGSTLLILVVSVIGDWFGRRRSLIAMALVISLGGAVLALWPKLGAIIAAALAGGISANRLGPASFDALEQAILPQTGMDSQRTRLFAHYNFLQTLGGALGALAAGIPTLLERSLGLDLLSGYRVMFLFYGGLGVALAGVYSLLGNTVETDGSMTRRRLLPPISSKRIIYGLSGLFAVDSFAGAVTVQSFLSYWFSLRFGFDAATLGVIFFTANLLGSLSFLIAARLAQRFGLINTMVFTHIPAGLLFIAMALAPTGGLAMAFFLARQLLSRMDIPTRQSYLMAVIKPQERTAAAGFTMLARTAAKVPGPSVAAYLMQAVGLASPMVFGGALKIAYDLALYFTFRRIRPPEERAT